MLFTSQRLNKPLKRIAKSPLPYVSLNMNIHSTLWIQAFVLLMYVFIVSIQHMFTVDLWLYVSNVTMSNWKLKLGERG